MTSSRLPIIRMVLMFAALSMTIAILTEGSLAGYRTRESGNEKARVAAFSIETTELELKSPDTLLDCNMEDDTVQMVFYVRNHSETAVNYSIRVMGIPENVGCDIQNARGILTENGGEAEVGLCLFVEDPSDRTMIRTISGLEAEVAVSQAKGTE